MESHAYREPADLQAIKEVLRAGRIEAPTAGHWHPGEIDWWFFYGPERLARTTIWTDVDGAAGWVLVDGVSRSADAGIRPDLRGSPGRGGDGRPRGAGARRGPGHALRGPGSTRPGARC